MRKNISITNPTVLEVLEQSSNASKFIEQCILFYLSSQESDTILVDEIASLREQLAKQLDTIYQLSLLLAESKNPV